MGEIKWSPLKSQRLKRTRGVSFEEIVQAEFLGIRKHPSRPDQRVYIFDYKGYVRAVPFAVAEDRIFLKTLYRSRKDMKFFKRRLEHEKDKTDQAGTMD